MSTTASETLLNHWIGGRRDERAAERHGEVTDPATGEVVARVPFATADDVDRAVAAATEAARGWGATSLTRRDAGDVRASASWSPPTRTSWPR